MNVSEFSRTLRSRLFRATALSAVGLIAASLSAQDTWTFAPGVDPFDGTEILTMRHLNEDVAGENGYVYRLGDKLYLGDGTPVRFWATNNRKYGNQADMAAHAKALAKRGINLARFHQSIYPGIEAASIDTPNYDVINIAKLNVVELKKQGIYTNLSIFFITGFRISADWGIEGYDEAFVSANDRAPFALLFWNEKYQNAYKNWVSELMTTPNQYDDDQTPLAEDPAVAFFEIQNEDNFFFHTFNPAIYPAAQRHKLEEMFAAWALEKYETTSLDDVISAWNGKTNGNDNLEAGRLGLVSAFNMTLAGTSVRTRDQVQFLTELTRDFYSEMARFLREDIGYQGLTIASNWKTANDARMLDLEHYSYIDTDVVDHHNYFNALISERVGRGIGPGDVSWTLPATQDPARQPSAVKQVESRARMISETAWVTDNPYRVEAPLMAAAFSALQDMDVFTWFASERIDWAESLSQWPVGIPTQMGQYPGAALLYRRGDVAEAETVVREGRSLESLFSAETALVTMSAGFDSARDNPDDFNVNPEEGAVDSLSMVVGKVEIGFDTDDDYVSPKVGENIDIANGIVTSSTGQIETNMTEGVMTIDTPLSQAVVGRLSENFQYRMSDVLFQTSSVDYGAVLVTSLDNRPINQSTRLLVQVGMPETPTGWEVEEVSRNYKGETVAAERILNIGETPWIVERAKNLKVRLLGNSRVTALQVAGPNGYFERNLIGVQRPDGYQFDFPEDELYVVVSLSELANYTPVVTSRSLPNAHKDRAYFAHLFAAPGDGVTTFSVEGLPSGLSADAAGVVTGTALESGSFDVTVTVSDEDGDTDSLIIPLVVYGEAVPVGWDFDQEIGWLYHYGNGWAYSSVFGMIYEQLRGAGFIYQPNAGWMRYMSGQLENWLVLYSYTEGWIGASEAYGAWYYRYGSDDWSTFTN